MNGAEIAIIGMSGRFPDANGVDQFWKNLVDGRESVKFLSGVEIAALNSPELTSEPLYVNAKGGMLEGTEYFDSSFFGYTPREVEIMDPQFRIFHECVWEALEDAGYAGDDYAGLVGLFAGASGNFPWQKKLVDSGKYENRKGLASIQFLERDFLTSLISYNLNLKGPSFSVNTACSTSLVAIHLACQALLNGECDIAMAGGVSIALDTENGYLYQAGSILSPDGHCRAFDALAKGSIYGSGAGVVTLRLLDEAIKNKDNIYAVIKGSAINNDGKAKVGFTAPSVTGQAEVIRTAQRIAEVNPEDIGYIEAHGTGTELGDPIEIEALKMAFDTSCKNYCAIGSVKTNVGHLDAAAGITGLIKTALILKHKTIPASLNFEEPNHKIDFGNSPFYVNRSLKAWDTHKRRIAGISSFGIGGTNAHVILEEYPEVISSNSMRSSHLFAFSARTEKSYQQYLLDFEAYLTNSSDKIEDIAYTLVAGRKKFVYRGFCVFNQEKTNGRQMEPAAITSGQMSKEPFQIVFMFPGQGSQYLDMGFDLYQKDPVFRDQLSTCFDIYQAVTRIDLRELIFPGGGNRSPKKINETAITQPLLFVFEYSIAKYLMYLGIKPDILIGHSIGEYTAACLAGVFSFEDGLQLVIKRGEIIQSLSGGSMLSVGLPEEMVKRYMNGAICLAAVNSSAQCVVSGPTDEIVGLQKELSDHNISSILLETSHAFHSSMMEPAMVEFLQVFERIALNPPQVPVLSNVTGEMMTPEEATSPVYWAQQLRQPVRFADGIEKIQALDNVVFMETGPGNALSNFITKHAGHNPSHKVVSVIRHKRMAVSDMDHFLNALGKLWLLGVDPVLKNLYDHEERQKVSIPRYAFEKQKVNTVKQLLPPSIEKGISGKEKNKPGEWFFSQVWSQNPVSRRAPGQEYFSRRDNWLIFDQDTLPLSSCPGLETCHVKVVTIGKSFGKNGLAYTIDPLAETCYQDLLDDLGADASDHLNIVHTWSLSRYPSSDLDIERYECAMRTTFDCLINLVRAIGYKYKSTQLIVLTNNVCEVVGNDLVYPELAPALALVKILPLEYPSLSCRLIDISTEHLCEENSSAMRERIFQIISGDTDHKITAVRGNYEWLPEVRPVHLETPALKYVTPPAGKIYLILGLGGIAIHVAKYLTEIPGTMVFIIHRSAFPLPGEWDGIIAENNDDQLTVKVQILDDICKKGVGQANLIRADITDMKALEKHVEAIEGTYGHIFGVINAAGQIDQGGIVQRRSTDSIRESMKSKVLGTLVVDQLFKHRRLDLFILFSSLGNELYEEKFGEIAYNASNEFIDAYCYHQSAIKRKIVINWCDWQQVGMSVTALKKLFHTPETLEKELENFCQIAIKPEDGIAAFAKVCDSQLNRVLIYPFDLQERLLQRDTVLGNYAHFLEGKFKVLTADIMPKTFEFSSNDTLDKKIINIWKDYLGHEHISPYDNIFELGASSLDVVKINGILRSSLDIDVPVTTLFEYPTIGSFVKYLKGNDNAPDLTLASDRIERGMSKLQKLKNIKRP